MPSMDAAFRNQGQLVMPVFSASLPYDPVPMYPAAALPPPPPPSNPPPKWGQVNRHSWKRNGFNSKNNSKHNTRVPSTKVNIKRLQQQNAKGARRHFKGELLTLWPARPLNQRSAYSLNNCVSLQQQKLTLLAVCHLHLTIPAASCVIKQVRSRALLVFCNSYKFVLFESSCWYKPVHA